MGAQFDAFVPTIVPSLAGQKTITRGTLLAAGGTNTIFVDGQSMFSLCGKWKLSGDGSAGQVCHYPLFWRASELTLSRSLGWRRSWCKKFRDTNGD